LVAPAPTPVLTARKSTGWSNLAPPPKVVPATVALGDFAGGSVPPDKKTEFWGKALASFMIADLEATQNLRVVDREHLAEILREQQLSASDLADPATRLRVGKIVGAKYFIYGTYNIIGQEAVLSDRIFSVETGQDIEADSIAGDKQHLRELSQQLAGKFLRPIDQVVAEQEMHPVASPGGPPPEAVGYFKQGLGFEQAAQYERAIEMFTQALAVYPHYWEARSELEKASQSAARTQ